MAKQLPPAKKGTKLQHSRKALSRVAPTDAPAGREMTPDERQAAKAKVQEAYQRAGLGTPEKRAKHNAEIQQHVPRMVAWYNREFAKGNLTGHGDLMKRTPWQGGTEVYRRSSH
jgi:hypothetical protein